MMAEDDDDGEGLKTKRIFREMEQLKIEKTELNSRVSCGRSVSEIFIFYTFVAFCPMTRINLPRNFHLTFAPPSCLPLLFNFLLFVLTPRPPPQKQQQTA